MADLFPTTLNTWIGRRLLEGDDGRKAINRHIMSVYAWPLQVYFRSTAQGWLGEADDLVGGFFASRLERPEFFLQWLQSGMRLRRWILNAFCFYLKEVRRERRRSSREQPLLEAEETKMGPPEEAIDREFAVSIVRDALTETRRSCSAKGLAEHWEIFFLHYYDGVGYAEITESRGIDSVRAATMARTVAARFRTVLRRHLSRDGSLEGQIDGEIRSLLEVTVQ